MGDSNASIWLKLDCAQDGVPEWNHGRPGCCVGENDATAEADDSGLWTGISSSGYGKGVKKSARCSLVDSVTVSCQALFTCGALIRRSFMGSSTSMDSRSSAMLKTCADVLDSWS